MGANNMSINKIIFPRKKRISKQIENLIEHYYYQYDAEQKYR